MHQVRRETEARRVRRPELHAVPWAVLQLLAPIVLQARQLEVLLRSCVCHDHPDPVRFHNAQETGVVHFRALAEVVPFVLCAGRPQQLAFMYGVGGVIASQLVELDVDLAAHRALAVAARLPLLQALLLVPQFLELFQVQPRSRHRPSRRPPSSPS